MEKIQPNASVVKEALELSEEILKNIELDEIPLSNIALKTTRLARLLNEFDYQKIMEYEAGGYPLTPSGVQEDVFKLGRLAKRNYQKKDKYGKLRDFIHIKSIEQLELEIESAKIGLEAATDRNVSVSSSNPDQYVFTPPGNTIERNQLRQDISSLSDLISRRRSFIYSFVLNKNHELKYSGISSDAFSRIRESVNNLIVEHVPSATQKFSAIYENLLSENPEDWSNAVHSCRRILIDLADIVFSPQKTDRHDKEGNPIKLGKDNYVNRLICFAEDNTESKRFTEIVGSHIKYLGERLDSICSAAQKGSHSTVDKLEADRYVVYTYMIVGDILSLKIQ